MTAMRGRLGRASIAACALLAGANTPAEDGSGAPGATEEPVENFVLESASGGRRELYSEERGRKATVIAFTAVDCPIAKLLAPRLGRIEKQYRGRGARFLGVDPNLQDSQDEIAAFARDASIDFPILLDPRQVVTDRLGVTRTTEVFVLDAEFRVVYRGAVDDQYSVGAARPEPTANHLIDALEASLAGRPVVAARTDAPGCLVGRVKQDAKEADVTFWRDAAPILWKNCAECHRPGQMGPMSFLDVDEARGWAPQIAEVVESGRMPPWHADPRYGHFENERRLTETEKRTLVLWAASGAKPGDPKDAPPAPTFADPEWAIGKPDLVLALPGEQQIPAEGVVPYRYVEVDPNLTADAWVQCVEMKAGNRAVTHHVGAYLLPPGMRGRQLSDGLLFGGSGPGTRPIALADGYGKRVPKGSHFLFELHYTPNGKAATDRTRMALRYSRVPVTHEVRSHTIANMAIDVPPNDPNATFTCTDVFRTPALLTSLMPHMHLRGKSFRFELERLSGERSILLDVPKYDFNWQHTYALAEPIPVAAGDKLRLTAVYDNSKDNPANPDPNRRVRWGQQTFEEMMVGFVLLELPVPPGSEAAGGSR